MNLTVTAILKQFIGINPDDLTQLEKNILREIRVRELIEYEIDDDGQISYYIQFGKRVKL